MGHLAGVLTTLITMVIELCCLKSYKNANYLSSVYKHATNAKYNLSLKS